MFKCAIVTTPFCSGLRGSAALSLAFAWRVIGVPPGLQFVFAEILSVPPFGLLKSPICSVLSIALTPYDDPPEAMTRNIAFLILSAVMVIPTQRTEGQSRLARLSVEQEKDDYYVILQRVFHRIYGRDVVVAELFAPGDGNKESATGVLKMAKGYEAFALFASPSVWKTEYRRFLQGTEEHCVDDAGRTIPCPAKTRSKSAVTSYRDIRVIMKRRVLSADIAGRLEGVWQQRVQEALHRPTFSDYENTIGGLEHYYSVRSRNHNWATILGQNSDENTDPGRMAALARALRGYVLGVVSETELTKTLITVEGTESVPHP